MATKFEKAVNEDVRAQKDALENLNTQENIKKDSNRYFSEKFWKILNFISQNSTFERVGFSIDTI